MKHKILRNHQSGLSLLELIISLGLGVIILLGLGKIYQVGNKSSSQSNVVIDLNEKAYKIMSMLEQDFERVGYIDLLDLNPNNPSETNGQTLINFLDDNISNIYYRKQDNNNYDTPLHVITKLQPIIACNGTFNEKPAVLTKIDGKATSPTPLLPTCVPGTGDDTKQSIQLTYQAVAAGNNKKFKLKSLQSSEDESSRLSGGNMDCLGGEISQDHYGLVSNRYFVKNGGLACSGSASQSDDSTVKSEELIDGVSEFVLRYYITEPTTSPDEKDKKVSGLYASKVLDSSALSPTAGRINANTGKIDSFDPAKSKDNPLGTAGITAVQVCLVLHSPETNKQTNIGNIQPTIPSCIENGNKKYSKPREAGDYQYYKRFVTTFSVPNMIYESPSEGKPNDPGKDSNPANPASAPSGT